MNLTGPELFAALRAKAASVNADGITNDNFRLKFDYKRDQHMMPRTIFGLERATVDHIAKFEEWFLPLVGNVKGTYEMKVYHESDALSALGFIKYNFDGPQFRDGEPALDPTPLLRADWTGPKKWSFPKIGGETPEFNFGAAPAPYQRTPYAGAQQPTTAGQVDFARQDLERRERAMELAHFKDELRRERPAESGGMLVTLAPLMMEWLKEQAAERKADRERDDQRRRDDAERARLDREASDKRFAEIAAGFGKKSPLEDKLLERALQPPDETATKMLASMGQAMSMMTQNSIQLMHLQLEWQAQNSPEDDGPIMRMLNKGLDAYITTVQAAGEAVDDNAKQLNENNEHPEEAPDSPDLEPLPALELALRKQATVDVITERLIAAFKDAEFKTVIAPFLKNGEFRTFIGQRLGGWIFKDPDKRVAYLNAVLVPALKECVRLGLVADHAPAARPEEQRPTETKKQKTKPVPPPPPKAAAKPPDAPPAPATA